MSEWQIISVLASVIASLAAFAWAINLKRIADKDKDIKRLESDVERKSAVLKLKDSEHRQDLKDARWECDQRLIELKKEHQRLTEALRRDHKADIETLERERARERQDYQLQIQRIDAELSRRDRRLLELNEHNERIAKDLQQRQQRQQ